MTQEVKEAAGLVIANLAATAELAEAVAIVYGQW